MKKLTIGLIKVYQKFLNPNLKLFGIVAICRYTPTCSEYSIKAVEKYGTLKGISLSIKRIASCQPFSKGGFQPVP